MTKIRPGTRDAIIEAAFLTFNDTPGAVLADVAKRAGVGRATLHRHFKSRTDLLVALAQTAMDELEAVVEAATSEAQSYREALHMSLCAVIPLASRQWFLSHEDFGANPALVARHQASIDALHATIEGARAEGRFPPDLPTPWIAEVYENLIYAAWTMVRAEEATTRQAADMAWRTFVKGVSK
ncbi:MAG: TetR/AcrR family transcriptional regulator [Pseudomonadota bacterium]